jgi:acylphosphatase/gas vesicle protein
LNSKAVRIRVTGRVQRVGLRRYVLDLAQDIGISGYVGNLPDGSVEIFAQGEELAISKFIEELKNAPHPVLIKNLIIKEDKLRPEVKEFSIKYGSIEEELQEGFGAMQSIFIEYWKEFRDYRQEFRDYRQEFRDYRQEFRDYRQEFREFASRTDNNFKVLGDELRSFRQEFKDYRNEFREFAKRTDNNFKLISEKYEEISNKLTEILNDFREESKRTREILEELRKDSKETREQLAKAISMLADAIDKLKES